MPKLSSAFCETPGFPGAHLKNTAFDDTFIELSRYAGRISETGCSYLFRHMWLTTDIASLQWTA
jgi:hypothetical protein